ncbi:MAG: hypothetical protein AAF281_06435 [Pseudomonadota bacterium]
MPIKLFTLLMALLPAVTVAQTHTGNHSASPSIYAGEETRPIKSLSQQDMREIARGGGWGLAKAAELNGVPGPMHVLELADQIGLTARQRVAVEAVRAQMQAEAIAAGKRFVAAEDALDAAFQQGAPDAETLARLVADTGTARASLRLVHLNAHLLTLPLLTEAQVSQYSVLRGYAADPCAAVPSGHDPAMWRRHNGCD